MTAAVDQQLVPVGTAVAGAIGAAISQRKMTCTSNQQHYRHLAISRRGESDPKTVVERLNTWITERQSDQIETARAPEVVPPATQGATIALAGGSGGRSVGWTPGIGAIELAKHTQAAILAGEPGFNGTQAFTLARLLSVLTAD